MKLITHIMLTVTGKFPMRATAEASGNQRTMFTNFENHVCLTGYINSSNILLIVHIYLTSAPHRLYMVFVIYYTINFQPV